jgi:hypothetical protein
LVANWNKVGRANFVCKFIGAGKSGVGCVYKISTSRICNGAMVGAGNYFNGIIAQRKVVFGWVKSVWFVFVGIIFVVGGLREGVIRAYSKISLKSSAAGNKKRKIIGCC